MIGTETGLLFSNATHALRLVELRHTHTYTHNK